VKKEKETAAGDEARAALVMALIVLPYPVMNRNDATTMRHVHSQGLGRGEEVVVEDEKYLHPAFPLVRLRIAQKACAPRLRLKGPQIRTQHHKRGARGDGGLEPLAPVLQPKGGAAAVTRPCIRQHKADAKQIFQPSQDDPCVDARRTLLVAFLHSSSPSGGGWCAACTTRQTAIAAT